MRLILLLFALGLASISSGAMATNSGCGELSGLRATPPVWIASDSDTKLILIATIHLLPPQTQWRSDALDKAIKSADELIVDTSIRSAQDVGAAYVRHAVNSNLPPVRNRIRPDLLPPLLAAAAQLKIPSASLDKMKTWALSFLVRGNRKSTCESGISLKLENEFNRIGRKVTALQTPDQSLADFDALPESAQGELLAQALGSSEEQVYLAMTRAWAAGDLSASAEAARAEMGKSPALNAMLARQKARFGAGLVQMMAEPGTKLVVLGALDFDGSDSVLEILKRDGYKVRRLQ